MWIWVAIAVAVVLFASRMMNAEEAPLAVDPKHPLWVDAIAKAQESMTTFRELWVTQSDRALLKVRLTTNTGKIEHVWASAVDFLDDRVRVRIETPPVTQRGEAPPARYVPLADIEDWTVALPDGTFRGGYTEQAMLLMLKEQGKLSKRKQAYLGRFLDPLR